MSNILNDLRMGYHSEFRGMNMNKLNPMINDQFIKVLKDDLHKGAVTVEFTKVNGEHRVMVCTLNPKLITEAQVSDPALMPDPKEFNVEGYVDEDYTPSVGRKNPDVLRVWEIHTGWRSFKLVSIISTTPVVPFV